MKVSIITVCFNSVATIEDTIESVLAQDHRDIEYIVIDGGSTDGTLDILKKYRGRISKCISEPDRGIYDAMNKGIRLSTGDIIATLNSDDIYADRSVVGHMVGFISSSGLDAGYGDLVYVDRRLKNIVRTWRPGPYKQGAFRRGWVIPHPAFFCRKEVFSKYGFFSDKFRIAADFELMLRFLEKYHITVDYLPEMIVKMRIRGKANTLRGILRGNYEIIKSFRMNGLSISPWFFILKPLAKVSQLSIFGRSQP
jgi:glycosyltransferase involved in cell wall biosynthesis